MPRITPRLLLPVTLAALIPSVTWADDQSGRATPAPTPSPADADPNSIVVTGISHATQLQSAPVSVTLFTAKKIAEAGIQDPARFLALTPGVTFNNSMQSESQITVRGIAQTNKPGANSPVAVVIDGVPIQDPAEFSTNYYNLEQIEILKGPQSALYGRNAIAGAIVINTQKPPSEFEGRVMGGASNGGGYKGEFDVGGPLVRDLANFSFTVAHQHLDGLHTNITTGKGVDYDDETAASGRIYITPAAGLAIDLKAAFEAGRNGSFQYVGLLESNPYYGKATINVNDQAPYTPDIEGEYKDHRSKVSARVTYDLPNAVLSSTTAYSTIHWRSRGSEYPYLPAADGVQELTQAAGDDHASFFQEFRITSSATSRFRYMLGVDFYDYSIRIQTNTGETDTRTALYGVGPFGPASADPTIAYGNDMMKTKAFGVFGDLGYDITTTLDAELALRYDYSKLTSRNDAPAAFTDTPGQERAASFDQIQPKFTLTWKPSGGFTLYGDYGRGFLAGGFNPAGSRETIIAAGEANTTVQNQYPAETADSFEAGFKSQELGHTLRINGAFYYTKIHNQQLYQFLPAASLAVIDQIAGVEVYGGEVDVNWRFLSGWTAETAVGLTHSRISAYPGKPETIGHKAPEIPPYNMSFGITREFHIGDIGGFARVDDTLRGPQTWEAEEWAGYTTRAINLVGARVGMDWKGWSLVGYVQNLANRKYTENVTPIFQTAAAVFYGQPRLYGLELSKKF